MRRVIVSSVCLVAFAIVAFAEEKPKPAPDITGLWMGVLKIGPLQLRLAFEFKKGDKDELKGTLISIDQNRTKVPCKSVTFADRKLTLDLSTIAASFTGTLNEKGTAINGDFTQLKQKSPLILKRIDKLPSINRPQMPKAPFPYVVEDLTFENKDAKIELAGTLTLPKGDGPFPAVVMVSGSGPQDRDETLYDHKPFLVIADHLARNGIACLRFDDRGIGKSKGKFSGATSADFATDAHSAVKYLKAHKKIDGKRIGICGHSEGGVIAPLVARDHPGDVGFIILLAGPGIKGEELLVEQRKDFSKLLGASDDDIKEGEKLMSDLVAIVKSVKTTEESKEKMTKAAKDFSKTIKDDKKRKEFDDSVEAIVARLSDPWMRWFITHDPAPVLQKVKCPVLAINGEKDIQVKAGQNLKAIATALKAGGNKNFTVEEFKGLNHLFQTCKTGDLSEYGQIEETVAPDVLKRLSKWIKELK